MTEKIQFKNCFVCSRTNPVGLHADIDEGDKKAWCKWTVKEEYVGYTNVLHGGILSAIMDDLMAHATYSLGVEVVTAHLEMDYKSPAYVGDELDCEAHVTEVGKGRSMRLEGTITCGDRLVAQSKSVMVIVDHFGEDRK